MTPQSDVRDMPPGSGRFATTQWTIVLAAAGAGSAADGLALAQLCQRYWYPLYVFIRRSGRPAHEAEDLTQEFFARLLSKQALADVDRAKGKFRSFLLGALKHFLANEYDRTVAQKRGGGEKVLSLDHRAADSRYGLEPHHELTPEKLFERRWALALLEQVLARLEQEQIQNGKRDLFDQLKPHLTPKRGELKYAEVAEQTGMSEGGVKVAIHRLRRRYRELLYDEIGQTVADPQEIEEELKFLRSCL